MLDSLEDLRLFVLIYEQGSLRAAADRAGLTPAAVSKRLFGLEDRLRTRLFNRTTRRISPTADGDAFHAHALAILDEVARAEANLTKQHTPTGRLRITASATFANLHLTPLIADFLDTHPQLAIDLTLTDRIVDLAAEGVDVAIRYGMLPDSGLIARKIAPCTRLICAAPAYLDGHGTPKTPNDLKKHACLIISGDDRWIFSKREMKGDTEETVRVRGPFTSTLGEAVRQMAVAGKGLVRLADWHAAADLKTGALIPVLTDWRLEPDIGIYAVYPTKQNLAPKVRAFVDFLADQFAHRFSPRS